jgi:hypothetical protein
VTQPRRGDGAADLIFAWTSLIPMTKEAQTAAAAFG